MTPGTDKAGLEQRGRLQSFPQRRLLIFLSKGWDGTEMGMGREKRRGPRDPVNSYSKFWRD